MKTVALIPARFNATRFPGKLMKELEGKTVIRRTYEAVKRTGLFDDVIAVCDGDPIYTEIVRHGGKAVKSKRPHESGTDRIAEAAADLDADIVVNVQGDYPTIHRAPLSELLAAFAGKGGKRIQVASLMRKLTDWRLIRNPNYVKVAVDKDFNALFFSRSPIPYPRSKNARAVYYEHVGVYAFRRQTLLDFTALPVSPLEDAEKIECLRFLENGIPLRMVVTRYQGVEIDVPQDLKMATRSLRASSRVRKQNAKE